MSNKHQVIQRFEQQRMKKEIPAFHVGDTVRVSCRIVDEAGKERTQAFAGTVIARTGSGLSETFSVHRVAFGEGMERVFYLHSPLVAGIEVIRSGSVRRSKLYYLRGTSGKSAKVKARFVQQVQNESTEQAVEVPENAEVTT